MVDGQLPWNLAELARVDHLCASPSTSPTPASPRGAASEELVFAGRVTVGGEVVRDPARDVTEADPSRSTGGGVALERRHVVLALNKPAGYVSTARDPQGRPTVARLVERSRERLYPVGRLDADTTGLILLTNDGELAHQLTHPPTRSARLPRPGPRPPVREPALRRLREGVLLEDGMTAPAGARRLTPDGSRSRSTRAASARSGGCSTPSGTPW